jgi:hypothetical protein
MSKTTKSLTLVFLSIILLLTANIYDYGLIKGVGVTLLALVLFAASVTLIHWWLEK